MSFTAIVSGVFAIAKAVPIIMRFFTEVNNRILEEKLKEIDIKRVTLNDQRNALLKALKKAETNEEIIALSITLHNINTSKL